RPLEPLTRVVSVVGMLGHLDVVEEPTVDRGLTRGSDRFEQDGRAVRVAAADRRPPPLVPASSSLLPLGGRYSVEEGGLVEKRMPDPAVSPVEQGHVETGPTCVAWVEVAVHQRVRQAAPGEAGETGLERVDEAVEQSAFVAVELRSRSFDDVVDVGRE